MAEEERGEEFPSVSTDRLVYEWKWGLLKHDVDNLWSGFSREAGWDFNLEILFSPSLALWGGELRPALGASWSEAGDTSRLYLDGRWQIEFDNRIYTGIGLGIALHDGETEWTSPDRKALGSTLLFHIPLEVGYRMDPHNSISLYFDHISNGYTQNENEGLDSLGMRYGYRF